MDKHIEKILFKSSYKINEDVKYNKIDSSYFDDDDDFSNLIGEDEEGEEDNEDLVDDKLPQEESSEESEELPEEEPISLEDEQPEESSEKSVDLIQNEIIKSTISTMNMIHGKLKDLENNINLLNDKYGKLQADVDEVKEPTNQEKLETRTQDSYPFYKNLDDVWKTERFDNITSDDGVIRLKDGTYVALYDNLGDLHSGDINRSFYDYK